MRAERPPDLHDGGYWYVVEAVEDEHGIHPGEVPGPGWTAVYGEVDGVLCALVRTPDPVSGMRTLDVPAGAVLSAAGFAVRPRQRIEGR